MYGREPAAVAPAGCFTHLAAGLAVELPEDRFMLYFLIRVLVNSLAAALVMHVVPGLRLSPYSLVNAPVAATVIYLEIGLIFTLLRAVVRPLILFLAGRLYLWSMGLLALAVDTFIFLLLSYLAPTVWQVGGTRLFSAILGAMLMGLVVAVLEALTGLDSPLIAEGRRSPFYWRWLGMLPTGQRNRIVESLRTQQMVNTIQRYMVDIVVGISPFGGIRRTSQRLIYRRRQTLSDQSPAAKMRLMLQELGPTFVKFGQMVSSRSELLPEAWLLELEQLHDDVAPFPASQVEQVIRRELGKPPAEAFAAFDLTPLAAASTAQVHAATLPSGEHVVVKVLRPDIAVTVKGDLNVMQDGLALVERRLPWSRQFGGSALFHEFAANVLTELDLANEAYNARMLAHNMAKFPWVHVPQIYGAYSTSKVLTQERVTGVKINDGLALDAAGIDREALATRFLRALLQQVIFDGFFHADPHPGNVWVNTETGNVIFLDMGLMGYLTAQDRFSLGELIWALQDRDARAATRVLVAMCKPAPQQNFAILQRDIERLINHNLLFTDAPPSLTLVMSQIVEVLVHHGLQMRAEFTLAIKSIGQGESIMRSLLGDKPTDYMLDVAYTQLKELLRSELAPGDMLDRVGKPLAHDILGRLPGLLTATTSLLDDFQRGQLAFQVTVDSLDERTRTLRVALELSVRRVVISVLAVGLLLGSALTLLFPLEGIVEGAENLLVRRVAELGFTVGALLILALLLSVLWQSVRKQTKSQ